MIEDFLHKLKELGYQISSMSDGGFKIFLDCCPQWHIVLHDLDSERFFPYFYFRKKRVEEVTDLHEIVPVVLTCITRCYGTSTFRFLGEHNDFSGIEDELYGMYWFPAQPLNERIRKNSEKDFECFFKILFDLFVFHSYQGDIFGATSDEKDDFSFESPELDKWVANIISFIGGDFSYVANLRVNPNWLYFRSFKKDLSVIQSNHAASIVKNISLNYGKTEKRLDGVNSRICISNDIYTSIPFSEVEFAKNLLASLGDTSEMQAISQENQIVFASDKHLIVRHVVCGLEAVSEEKELIQKRQQKEIALLFGDKKFVWNIADRKSSSDFEDLVLELLNREAWIFSVKKVAPTNQGDNGRDLICEYNTLYNKNQIPQETNSVNIGNMIVQCKTNLKDSKRKSIGRSDVDMEKTLFDYRPDGYMLVVNTQVTRDLTEALERQRDRKEQNAIIWWNSFDVEDRLRKHPDILARYKHIVDYEQIT